MGALDGIGEGEEHVHVMAAGHLLADRHDLAPPGLGDALVLAQKLLALVAAHHGKVRLSIRSLPGEEPPAPIQQRQKPAGSGGNRRRGGGRRR